MGRLGLHEDGSLPLPLRSPAGVGIACPARAAAPLAGPRPIAGQALQAAQLLGGPQHRGPAVVLVPGEEMPAHDHELAGDGHRRHAGAAPAPYPQVEGAQGPPGPHPGMGAR